MSRLSRFLELPRSVQMRKIRTRLVGGIAGRLYVDLNHDVDRSLLISGTPRSGSTWLADLLLEVLPYRLIFEPIRHGRTEMQSYEAHYLREGKPDQRLRDEFSQLLSGERREFRLDSRNRRLISRGRLIKGVSTNLLLGWFQEEFPTVPVVYLVRHPLLVVASYMRMSWLTPKDPAHWLAQEDLVADHLAPFRSIIESATSRLEKSALEWCVLNYVPSQQSHSDRLVRVMYEDLLREPQGTLTNMLKSLGIWQEGMHWKGIHVPSHTAESTVADREVLAHQWRSVLSDSERGTVERYLDEFGFQGYLNRHEV